MIENVEIRESAPDDGAAIEALYPEAFPDEDLLPLVRDLLREPSVTLSLVATSGATLVGHVIFTECHVAESSGTDALLAPLAVKQAWQRQGIGSALVRAGLLLLQDAGVNQVYVLGDPAYYARLGFRAETGAMPPYELPPEWAGAWQSQSLAGVPRSRPGKLLLPRAWLNPALWAP